MKAEVRAVALHDVSPRTFVRCREIRDWLLERGVDHATLLVIPAGDLHPFWRRSPALHDWLHHRVEEGDCVAQHGLLHRRGGRGSLPRAALAWLQGGRAAEFVGLDPASTRERVRTGRAILRDAGLEPRGFVAPAYAYTPSLRRELSEDFDWYADLARVFGRGAPPKAAPAWCLGTTGVVRRALSPFAARGASSFSRSLLRIDIHPADFDHPGHVRALAMMVQRTATMRTVVYDQLFDA
jgi:predicted deacetylase